MTVPYPQEADRPGRRPRTSAGYPRQLGNLSVSGPTTTPEHQSWKRYSEDAVDCAWTISCYLVEIIHWNSRIKVKRKTRRTKHPVAFAKSTTGSVCYAGFMWRTGLSMPNPSKR